MSILLPLITVVTLYCVLDCLSSQQHSLSLSHTHTHTRTRTHTHRDVSVTLTFEPITMFKFNMYAAMSRDNPWYGVMNGGEQTDEEQDSIKVHLWASCPVRTRKSSRYGPVVPLEPGQHQFMGQLSRSEQTSINLWGSCPVRNRQHQGMGQLSR